MKSDRAQQKSLLMGAAVNPRDEVVNAASADTGGRKCNDGEGMHTKCRAPDTVQAAVFGSSNSNSGGSVCLGGRHMRVLMALSLFLLPARSTDTPWEQCVGWRWETDLGGKTQWGARCAVTDLNNAKWRFDENDLLEVAVFYANGKPYRTHHASFNPGTTSMKLVEAKASPQMSWTDLTSDPLDKVNTNRRVKHDLRGARVQYLRLTNIQTTEGNNEVKTDTRKLLIPREVVDTHARLMQRYTECALDSMFLISYEAATETTKKEALAEVKQEWNKLLNLRIKPQGDIKSFFKRRINRRDCAKKAWYEETENAWNISWEFKNKKGTISVPKEGSAEALSNSIKVSTDKQSQNDFRIEAKGTVIYCAKQSFSGNLMKRLRELHRTK